MAAGRTAACVGVPHSAQNFAVGLSGAPQEEHPASRRLPHSGQNF
jgi:hypothetical protein